MQRRARCSFCIVVSVSVEDLSNRLSDVERLISNTVMDDILKIQSRMQHVEATLESLSDVVAPLLQTQDAVGTFDEPDVPAERALTPVVPAMSPDESPFSMPRAPSPQAPGRGALSPQRPITTALSPGDDPPATMREIDNMIHDMQQLIIMDVNAKILNIEKNIEALHEQMQHGAPLRGDVPYNLEQLRSQCVVEMRGGRATVKIRSRTRAPIAGCLCGRPQTRRHNVSTLLQLCR